MKDEGKGMRGRDEGTCKMPVIRKRDKGRERLKEYRDIEMRKEGR